MTNLVTVCTSPFSMTLSDCWTLNVWAVKLLFMSWYSSCTADNCCSKQHRIITDKTQPFCCRVISCTCANSCNKLKQNAIYFIAAFILFLLQMKPPLYTVKQYVHTSMVSGSNSCDTMLLSSIIKSSFCCCVSDSLPWLRAPSCIYTTSCTSSVNLAFSYMKICHLQITLHYIKNYLKWLEYKTAKPLLYTVWEQGTENVNIIIIIKEHL